MFVEKTVRDVIVFVEAQHAAPFPAAQPKERCNLELHEIPETLFVWFVIFVVEKDFVRPNNIPRELQKARRAQHAALLRKFENLYAVEC